MFYTDRLYKKILSLLLCVAFALSLAACSNTSAETSILKEDDSYGDLIEEANRQTSPDAPLDTASPETEGSATAPSMADSILEVSPEAAIKGDYVASFQNYQGNIKVVANAVLDVPRTDGFSIYSAKKMPITQELTDKIRSALMGNTPIFEGDFLKLQNDVTHILNSIKETGSQTLIAEYEKMLDDLLPADKRDISKFAMANFPSDGAVTPIKDLYAQKPYCKRQFNLYPDGEYLYAISDGSDGTYHSLTVLNSHRRGNSLSYNKNGMYFTNNLNPSAITEKRLTDIYGDMSKYTNDPAYDTPPENYIGYSFSEFEKPDAYIPENEKKMELKAEDAIKMADSFLEKMGINGFECYENLEISDELFRFNGKIIVYRTAHKLTYYRKLDGIFLTQSSGTKHNEALGAGNESTIYWRGESIQFYINDDGIVKFILDSPLEITEVVSTDITVKGFEEIKPLFESVITTQNSRFPEFQYTYHVNKVRLSYSRIGIGTSNYESGLIVPMWDFSGESHIVCDDLWSSTQITSSTFLAINAIDCSIIQPQLGYY